MWRFRRSWPSNHLSVLCMSICRLCSTHPVQCTAFPQFGSWWLSQAKTRSDVPTEKLLLGGPQGHAQWVLSRNPELSCWKDHYGFEGTFHHKIQHTCFSIHPVNCLCGVDVCLLQVIMEQIYKTKYTTDNTVKEGLCFGSFVCITLLLGTLKSCEPCGPFSVNTFVVYYDLAV